MSVRLRKSNGAPTLGERAEAPSPIQIQPLSISALVVTKAALVQALKIYVPGLRDIELLEGGADGDRYLLTVEPTSPGATDPAS